MDRLWIRKETVHPSERFFSILWTTLRFSLFFSQDFHILFNRFKSFIFRFRRTFTQTHSPYGDCYENLLFISISQAFIIHIN